LQYANTDEIKTQKTHNTDRAQWVNKEYIYRWIQFVCWNLACASVCCHCVLRMTSMLGLAYNNVNITRI